MSRRSLALAILLLAALLPRAVYLAELRSHPTFDSPVVDAWVYDRAAREVAARGPATLEVPYYQPPLYIFGLGAIYAATGGSWLAPRVVQAILGALTVVLTALLAAPTGARRETGRAADGRAGGGGAGLGRAAGIAGVLMALYGPALYFEGELLPPASILALTTAALVLLLRADRAERPGARLAAAAFTLGVATAVRPTALLVAVGAGIWWLRGAAGDTGGGGKRARALGPAALALVLPILPFTIANWAGGGEPIPISWNGGINLWLGNGAGSDSLTAIQPGHAWDRLQVEPLRAGVTTRRGESAYWTRRALREAAADPGAWTAALGRKALRLLDARETARNTDYEVAREESRVLGFPLVVGFGLVFPLAWLAGVRGRAGTAPGTGGGRGDPDARRRTLLLWALAAVAVENLGFFPTGRYRLEAAPALCALAGIGIDGLLRAGRRALRPGVIAPLLAVLAIVHVDFLGEREIDRARAAINRGVAHRRADRDVEAAIAFREALAHDPTDPDAHRWLGEMALGAGDPVTALAHFDAALAGAPDYLRVLLDKAQALERADRRPEAEPVYQRALAVDPWATDLRLNFGVYLAIEGRKEEAREQFRTGLRIDPSDGRLERNLRRLGPPGGS